MPHSGRAVLARVLTGRAEARTQVVDRDPELIKQDIAQARDRLALTVDSLAERANPQRLADDLKSAVFRFIRKPAVAATLAGIGAITVVVVVRSIRR